MYPQYEWSVEGRPQSSKKVYRRFKMMYLTPRYCRKSMNTKDTSRDACICRRYKMQSIHMIEARMYRVSCIAQKVWTLPKKFSHDIKW